jgi:hypothetical protein
MITANRIDKYKEHTLNALESIDANQDATNFIRIIIARIAIDKCIGCDLHQRID